MKNLLLLLIIGILFLQACKSDQTRSSSTDQTTTTIPIPSFNRDSAYQFVAEQVAFGPRVPGSEAHQNCKNWLVQKLESYGATVIQQDFQAKTYYGKKLPASNIIAQFNPEITRRIVLAAHWDSRHIADSPLSTERKNEPILGADDGGSGTAVLLEIARQLQQNPVEMGIDLVLFDAEDLGESGTEDPASATTWCLGSQYWARNLHVPNYRPQYGILLDMVGSKGAQFPIEQYSNQIAPQLVSEVWNLAANLGYSNYFPKTNGGGVTDDHYFVSTIARIPMIDIINRSTQTQTGFGEYWHTHNDNMAIIDRKTLKAVGQLMLVIIYRENSGAL
ncbi:MAG: M28 family peptidase [Saprospiraceae bacterium]